MVDIVEEAGLSDNECVEIWNIGTEKRAVLLMMGTWIQCLEGCHMKNDDSEYDMPLYAKMNRELWLFYNEILTKHCWYSKLWFVYFEFVVHSFC
jgi:hypothetical protein